MFGIWKDMCLCTKSLQLCPALCGCMDRSLHPPRNLPDPGIEPVSLMPLALAGGFFTTSARREGHGKPYEKSKKNFRADL